MKSIIELWGQGSTRDEAGQAIVGQPTTDWLEYCKADVSVCFRVHTFGQKFSNKQKVVIMEVSVSRNSYCVN